MLEIGSRLKLTIGFFIILALLVLGYSGTKLLLLYDTPLFGVSSESKLAKRKWNRLKTVISQKGDIDWSKSINLLVKDISPPEGNLKKSNFVQEKKQVTRYKSKPLNKITGIIITSDPSGDSTASVMINDKIYTVNDEVSGYMIKKITKDGVSLTKDGEHFFLDAPTVPFSVDKGE